MVRLIRRDQLAILAAVAAPLLLTLVLLPFRTRGSVPAAPSPVGRGSE